MRICLKGMGQLSTLKGQKQLETRKVYKQKWKTTRSPRAVFLHLSSLLLSAHSGYRFSENCHLATGGWPWSWRSRRWMRAEDNSTETLSQSPDELLLPVDIFTHMTQEILFFFYDPVYVSFLVNCSAQRALSLRKFYYFLTFGWHLKLKNSGSSYLMSSQQACRSSLATLPLLCLVFRRKDDWVDWGFFITVVKCA